MQRAVNRVVSIPHPIGIHSNNIEDNMPQDLGLRKRESDVYEACGSKKQH